MKQNNRHVPVIPAFRSPRQVAELEAMLTKTQDSASEYTPTLCKLHVLRILKIYGHKILTFLS